jgi:hypothetical protein
MPRWKPPRSKKERYKKMRKDLKKNVDPQVTSMAPEQLAGDCMQCDVNDVTINDSAEITISETNDMNTSETNLSPKLLFNATNSSTPKPSYTKCSPQPILNRAGTKKNV